MIKIYFQAKPLFLCDVITPEINEYLHRQDTLFIDELDHHTVATMIYEMQQDNIYAGVFQHSNLNALLGAFKKAFTVILAGGGFVQAQNKALLIFRRGKWDLPKGKLDEGETIEACALREVAEETGLSDVRMVKPLTVTYHTYHEKEKFILKETHWFLMQAPDQAVLVPQTEEDIKECLWVTLGELSFYLSNTHPSVADVVHLALKKEDR
jgi:8-oxo-dGTP pyrophosphatase MutT (NUDIX family)